MPPCQPAKEETSTAPRLNNILETNPLSYEPAVKMLLCWHASCMSFLTGFRLWQCGLESFFLWIAHLLPSVGQPILSLTAEHGVFFFYDAPYSFILSQALFGLPLRWKPSAGHGEEAQRWCRRRTECCGAAEQQLRNCSPTSHGSTELFVLEVSPRMGHPPPLWATCSRVSLPLQWKKTNPKPKNLSLHPI